MAVKLSSGLPTQTHSSRWERWKGLVLAAAVGGAVVIVGALAFEENPNSLKRKFSDLLLQLGLIGVVGAMIAAYLKSEFDKASERREIAQKTIEEKLASDEQKRNLRLDFLHRMRAVHSSVEYAHWLIRAHRTVGVYSEQIRQLMLTTADLWEIHEDLVAAGNLFEPDDSKIQDGVRGIIKFLDHGTQEYETDAPAWMKGRHLDDPLPDPLDKSMDWLDEFIERSRDAEPHLPEKYDSCLKDSKGKMRQHIYGGAA